MEADPLGEQEKLESNLNTENNWYLWCRLCSKMTEESCQNLLYENSAVQRYFNIDIAENRNLPQRLCRECCVLVTSMLKFTEKVNQVQKMYDYILKSECQPNINIDVCQLREDFGVQKSTISGSFMHIYENLMKTETHIKDECLESEFEMALPIKETSEIESEEERVDAKSVRKHKKKTTETNEDLKALQNSDGTLTCDYCAKSFISKSNKEFHMRTIHSKSSLYICEQCGISTRTLGTLKEHMLTHTDDAPFQCKICHKNFKHQQRLKRHMEIHDPEKYICPKCGKQLNSRSTLNSHLTLHSESLRHKCQYCGRAFKLSKTLKNHLILHTGLRPYVCDFCGSTFAQGSSCRAHKKRAHPKELAEQEAAGIRTFTQNIPTISALRAFTSKEAMNLSRERKSQKWQHEENSSISESYVKPQEVNQG